ncbi:hypothetical protein L195_g037981 [Trifolium pratense]|uniref:Uncharacterized protein n=1 Tax=Trifolium pratense TaxID=57577 RepID=A0A2K3LTV2_TRIPR|nr:hypothetical protein L195_g037981 [Trifolium pratense]
MEDNIMVTQRQSVNIVWEAPIEGWMCLNTKERLINVLTSWQDKIASTSQHPPHNTPSTPPPPKTPTDGGSTSAQNRNQVIK